MALSGPGGGRDDEAEAFVDINITPLTDVILVLLVIFMVASTAVVESERAKSSAADERTGATGPTEGLAIELPGARRADATVAVGATVLRQAKDGGLELDGRPVSLEGLAKALEAVRAGAVESRELVIAADGAVTHAQVVELIDRARLAGFQRVVIGTASPTTTGGR